jgi:DNA-directed RNA polymerase specialized sigma subunit
MPLAPIPAFQDSSQSRDEVLIREWQGAIGFEKDKKLTELLQRFSGVIGQVVNQYRSAPIPLQTLELEAKRQAVLALRDWKPGMGAKPSTFVSTRVRQRLNRYVIEHQNTARIPEEHVRRIGAFNTAMTDLTDRYGREPSTHELADHMGIPVRHVSRLRKMLRADIPVTEESSLAMEDFKHDPEYEHAMMGYYSLTENEKAVFDYLTGSHGQPQLKAGDIAMRMKISKQRVSNLRASIGKKLSRYMSDSHG